MLNVHIIDNLSTKKVKIPYIQIRPRLNSINIFFNFNYYKQRDLFLVLQSYLKSNHYIIKNIYLVDTTDVVQYINITAVSMFSFLEFKTWWFNVENKIGYLTNSKIHNFFEKKSFFIKIEIANEQPCSLFPTFPWRKSFLQEHSLS